MGFKKDVLRDILWDRLGLDRIKKSGTRVGICERGL